jgi:AcrR family transcriptional regulator
MPAPLETNAEPGTIEPKSRRPGRPSGSTAGQRERLLDAALDLYARVGISAASLRSIAAQAELTPAMVHYYFGGKDELRDAVIEERIMPLIAQLRVGLEAAGAEPGQFAATFVRGMYAAVARAPWLPALWVREVLSEGGMLRDLLIARIAPQLPRPLAARFANAQTRGALAEDLDPRLLVVSLMGLTLLPFATAPLWRQIFEASDIDTDALLRHTLALLDHGLGGRRAT